MIIVIEAKDLEVSNLWMKETINPEGGDNFTLPLYTGDELTHYWCSVNLTDDQVEDMKIMFTPMIYDLKPQEVLDMLGLHTYNE